MVVGLKLRMKTILITGATLLFLICAIFTLEAAIMYQVFTLEEGQDVQNNVGRVELWLGEQRYNLEKSAEIWSEWGDTYSFILDPSTKYVESKFDDFAFVSTRVNFIAIYDENGSFMVGKAVDLTIEKSVPVPGMFEYLSPNDHLLKHKNGTDKKEGLMVVEGRPMFVASVPVSSPDDGRVVGTVVMGKYVDTTRIGELSSLKDMRVSVFEYKSLNMPIDFERMTSGSGRMSILLVREDASLKSYSVINDIYGKPAIVMRMEAPRDRYEMFRKNQSYFLAGATAIGLGIMTLNFVLLDMFVVARISKLRLGSARVAAEADSPTGRIQPIRIDGEYDDEIADLTKDMNGMIQRLINANQKIIEEQQKYRFQLESEVEQKTHMLVETNEQLRKMEETKNQFLFNIGHDLKTPLAVVEMNVNILKMPKVKAKQKHDSDDLIRRNILRLKQQIEEIIQLSKFEQGGSVQSEKFNLCDTVANEVNINQDFANANGVKIRIAGASKPIYVLGDRRLIAYAISNLLSNGIKYNGKEDIDVKIEQDDMNVTVAVADRGPGVPKEFRESLFKKFFRGDKTGPGTGVGLFMTLEIAKRHNGNAYYKPNAPKGSVFYFVLPKESAPEKAGASGRGYQE